MENKKKIKRVEQLEEWNCLRAGINDDYRIFENNLVKFNKFLRLTFCPLLKQFHIPPNKFGNGASKWNVY